MEFQQSLNNLPLTVTLGEKSPSWGLNRWAGTAGLRFIPSDDEGFSLRGDKKRLVYKGTKRSHRFTILGDTAFEYDCILEREPESNVVTFLIDGAAYFDFYKQPDFVKDPFLKGSYAVYKKNTLAGEGTGKLCHIHRPLIIDAKGRKVFGDLTIAGNELRIIIPEKWLGEASYPVIVDPVVGTTGVGSQNIWYSPDYEDDVELFFELAVPVNRFMVPETINSQCTAYVYVDSDDSEAGGRAVFYSDNGNKPLYRRSADEGFIDMRVKSGKPAGWRSSSFKSSESITAGSYIWFGVFCEYYWYPRFDYGQKCYAEWWVDQYDDIPDTYPYYNYLTDYDFKLSMYFDYTAGQNYIRTLTQGVSLTDKKNFITGFNRQIMDAVKTVAVFSVIKSIQCFLSEALKITDSFKNSSAYKRNADDIAGNRDNFTRHADYFRINKDNINPAAVVIKRLTMIIQIITTLFARDYLLNRFLKAREEIVLKSKVCRRIVLDSRIG